MLRRLNNQDRIIENGVKKKRSGCEKITNNALRNSTR